MHDISCIVHHASLDLILGQILDAILGPILGLIPILIPIPIPTPIPIPIPIPITILILIPIPIPIWTLILIPIPVPKLMPKFGSQILLINIVKEVIEVDELHEGNISVGNKGDREDSVLRL